MIEYIINFLAVLTVSYCSVLFIIIYRFGIIRKKLGKMNDNEILSYIRDYYDLPNNDFYCEDELWNNACEEYDKPKCKVQCERCAREMGKN